MTDMLAWVVLFSALVPVAVAVFFALPDATEPSFEDKEQEAPPATRTYDGLTERERHLLWKYRGKYLSPGPGEPNDPLELAKLMFVQGRRKWADERVPVFETAADVDEAAEWIEVCLLREELGWSNDYRHPDRNP